MKHNAFARNNPTLHRVWGPHADEWVLPDGKPVFVYWSPRHQSYIMSITNDDYGYDALVTDYYFRRDPTLDGPAWYLEHVKQASKPDQK